MVGDLGLLFASVPQNLKQIIINYRYPATGLQTLDLLHPNGTLVPTVQ